jgi:hypothetical protein
MRILDLHLRILFSSEITMTKHNFSQRLRESVITCKSRPCRKYTNTCGAVAASTSFLCASSQLAVAANSQGRPSNAPVLEATNGCLKASNRVRRMQLLSSVQPRQTASRSTDARRLGDVDLEFASLVGKTRWC